MLARILAKAPDKAQGARRSQATILTWDAATLENTVSWRGEVYTNMPLLTVTNAVDYDAGDIVILEGWAPEGKLSSWYIIGKVIRPPTTTPGD
ncbi:MAG TPA: hypothetical protein VGK49_06735 [Ilumatobacteraceae bacterium]